MKYTVVVSLGDVGSEIVWTEATSPAQAEDYAIARVMREEENQDFTATIAAVFDGWLNDKSEALSIPLTAV